jgi:predicted ferric reductase
MSTQVTWYVARSAGIVAWALAATGVLWGLALSTHALGTKPRPAWLFDLHRFLGGAAVIFTGIHIVAILADSYVHISLLNVLVPLTGTWHPVAVAWGIAAFYLLLAVELTSLARARVPKRVWRRVHYAGFGVFGLSTVHALTAGTDGRTFAFLDAVVVACGLIGVLTVVRIGQALRVWKAPAPVRATTTSTPRAA